MQHPLFVSQSEASFAAGNMDFGAPTNDQLPCSYRSLIHMVLERAPEGLTLNGIYAHITDRFPYLRTGGPSNWRSRVRNTLTVSADFRRIPDSTGRRSGRWVLANPTSNNNSANSSVPAPISCDYRPAPLVTSASYGPMPSLSPEPLRSTAKSSLSSLVSSRTSPYSQRRSLCNTSSFSGLSASTYDNARRERSFSYPDTAVSRDQDLQLPTFDYSWSHSGQQADSGLSPTLSAHNFSAASTATTPTLYRVAEFECSPVLTASGLTDANSQQRGDVDMILSPELGGHSSKYALFQQQQQRATLQAPVSQLELLYSALQLDSNNSDNGNINTHTQISNNNRVSPNDQLGHSHQYATTDLSQAIRSELARAESWPPCSSSAVISDVNNTDTKTTVNSGNTSVTTNTANTSNNTDTDNIFFATIMASLSAANNNNNSALNAQQQQQQRPAELAQFSSLPCITTPTSFQNGADSAVQYTLSLSQGEHSQQQQQASLPTFHSSPVLIGSTSPPTVPAFYPTVSGQSRSLFVSSEYTPMSGVSSSSSSGQDDIQRQLRATMSAFPSSSSSSSSPVRPDFSLSFANMGNENNNSINRMSISASASPVMHSSLHFAPHNNNNNAANTTTNAQGFIAPSNVSAFELALNLQSECTADNLSTNFGNINNVNSHHTSNNSESNKLSMGLYSINASALKGSLAGVTVSPNKAIHPQIAALSSSSPSSAGAGATLPYASMSLESINKLARELMRT